MPQKPFPESVTFQVHNNKVMLAIQYDSNSAKFSIFSSGVDDDEIFELLHDCRTLVDSGTRKVIVRYVSGLMIFEVVPEEYFDERAFIDFTNLVL